MGPRNRLYDVPPAEFTRARDALVKELKAAGKDEEAKQIAKLHKPAAALWVVNQLGRLAPKQVGALVDAAEKLKRAHRQGDSDALRAAMQEQREALRALEQTAQAAAAQIGAKASLELLRRVQNTAQSAAAAQPDALREGALEEELEPAGFETLLGTEIGAPRATHATHEPKRDAAEERKEREHAARELKRADHEAHELLEKAKQLEHAATRAQDAATEARRVADEARLKATQAQAAAQELRRRG